MALGLFPKQSTVRILIGIFYFWLFGGACHAQSSQKGWAADISGYLSLRLEGYHSDGAQNRYQPFTWILSGSPQIQIGNIRIPFRIQSGNLGISRYGQPFNKFGVSPTGTWWKCHLGHTALQWSPYTLGGRTFFGGGFEINPGRLRLGIIYGEFQGSWEEPIDTLDQKPSIILFKRNGYAFRIGFGNRHEYLDLIFFKARDDTSSLQGIAIPITATPQENTVMGISGRHRFSSRLQFHFDLAVSAYSQNLRSRPQDLEDSFWSRTLKWAFVPRLSSRYNLAADALLRYQHRKFDFQFRYSHLDPDYQSMGAYFLQHGVESLTGEVQLRIAKERLRIKGNYGWQHNNLLRVHTHQTLRQIGALHLQFAISSQWEVHLHYYNHSTELRRRREVLEDTLALHQLTQHLKCGTRWSYFSGHVTHSVFFEVFGRGLDEAAGTGPPRYRSIGCTGNYILQYPHIGVEFGGYLDRYRFGPFPYFRFQPHIRMSWTAKGNRFALSGRWLIGLHYREGSRQSTTLQPGLMAHLHVSDQSMVHAFINWIQHTTPASSTETEIREHRGGLSFTYRFK
jgi:hypothetical protein